VTRWRTAHGLVLESDDWKSDSELRKLPTLDILLAFEDYSRVKEREFEEQMRRSQVEKTRKERKAREGFKVENLYSSHRSICANKKGTLGTASKFGWVRQNQSQNQVERNILSFLQRRAVFEYAGEPRIQSS